jgi:TRAP-type C4-dicarboxylate transport system permease small subunit
VRTQLVAAWDTLLITLRRVSQLVLFFMMITICYDTFMRYVFAAPTSWSLEINSFLVVYLAVMGAAEAQRQDQHIRITFFVDKMSPSLKEAIHLLMALLGGVFCGILAWRGGILALQAWEYGERVSSAFGTPMVYPYAMIPIGFGSLAIQFVAEGLCAGRKLLRPAEGECHV